jgi:hypothetical protein
MSQADPFRDIVKQNVVLYRDSEEQREKSFLDKSSALKEWKKYHEVYIRAAKCLALCENSNLNDIGIFEENSAQKAVDKQTDAK